MHIKYLPLKIGTTLGNEEAHSKSATIVWCITDFVLLKFLVYSLFLGIAKIRVRGKSHVNDFTLAARACLPIISGILAEIKMKHYPQNCFLNIDVPTNVVNHKVNLW